MTAEDGIIHVTAFGCGPDAMVGKLIELEAKQKAVPNICISWTNTPARPVS